MASYLYRINNDGMPTLRIEYDRFSLVTDESGSYMVLLRDTEQITVPCRDPEIIQHHFRYAFWKWDLRGAIRAACRQFFYVQTMSTRTQ